MHGWKASLNYYNDYSMKNPYGLKNSSLVKVTDVERGLACGCVCPACEHPLEAHRGTIRKSYFSHYRGSDCGAGYETAVHLMAKEILLQEKKILLPELVATIDVELLKGSDLKTEIIVKPWTFVNLDSVYLEKKHGSIIPDVIVKKESHELLVEIKVTHGISKKKKESTTTFIKRGLSSA